MVVTGDGGGESGGHLADKDGGKYSSADSGTDGGDGVVARLGRWCRVTRPGRPSFCWKGHNTVHWG